MFQIIDIKVANYAVSHGANFEMVESHVEKTNFKLQARKTRKSCCLLSKWYFVNRRITSCKLADYSKAAVYKCKVVDYSKAAVYTCEVLKAASSS